MFSKKNKFFSKNTQKKHKKVTFLGSRKGVLKRALFTQKEQKNNKRTQKINKQNNIVKSEQVRARELMQEAF